MWKPFLILSLIFFTATCSQQAQPSDIETQYFAKVGEYITGRIDAQKRDTVIHHYQLDDNLEKKYLFLRLKSTDVLLSPVISVYDFDNRTLIHTCSLDEYPECYIKRGTLQPKQKLVILVSAKSDAVYNLQTYWGDLEHLKEDSQLHFMFDKNTSQLFHLEFDKKQTFEQIRIILEPMTVREDYDKLKMFLNFGTENQPTEKEHDMESIRVWNDAEAIFLTKQQVKGKDAASIYIVGNADTIYKLTCEFVRETHHDLEANEILYEYLSKNQSYVYHIDGSKIKEYDEYAFKFSVFNGEIGIAIFQDSNLTKAMKKQPFQYMSDIALYFTKSELKDENKNLYIKVFCPDASTIYQITLQGRQTNLASQVKQDILQFIMLKQEKKALFFKYPIFSQLQDQSTQQNKMIFNANLIRVMGLFDLKFYVCKESYQNWGNCIIMNDQAIFSKSVDQLKAISSPEVGSKTLYTLEVDAKYFQQAISVAKEMMIIAVFTSNKPEYSVAALEFSNPNKLKRIREDKAVEQQILAGNNRVYKYQNSDPQIQALQIHFNHISGRSHVRVTREDPRLANAYDQDQPGDESSTVFEIKENLTKPIYVTVFALSNTIFTISATVKHRAHADSSALTLAEDIPYKFRISPFDSKLIEIHPIESQVLFSYKSSGGPIYICETLYTGECDVNSQNNVNSSTSGEIAIDSTGKRGIKLRISNSYDPMTKTASFTFDNKTSIDEQLPNRVQVEVFYHAARENHCQEKKMSEVYSDVFKSGECVKFHIDTVANIQIMTHKQDVGRQYESFFICSKPIMPVVKNGRYLISIQEIQDSCTDSQNDMVLMILLLDQTRTLNDTIRYQYAVEYENEGVALKDGVSYTMKGISAAKQSPLKTFYYPLVDLKKSTEIILFNHKGTQKFYGNILMNKTKVFTQINENFALISSQNSVYFTNPEIELTPEMIKQSKCTKNCLLAISVYSEEPIGTEVEFTMEITSSSVVLGEDEVHTDFIGSGTYQYYRYQVKKGGQSLYVKVSDSNAHCSKIYISDKEYPSPSNILKSEVSGELVLDDIKNDFYYIGVEALDDCMYSISVSESNAHITKMQYGQFYDVRLNEDETKMFLVKHVSQKPFKILTLEKHGSLSIFANEITVTKDLIKKAEQDGVNYENFKFKSTYRNTLVVDDTQEGFCSDCFYLVVVRAEKITDSSIVLMGQNAKINLDKNKALFDNIKDTETQTLANFYMVSEGNIIAKVHQGKIKVEMSYGSQKYSYDLIQSNDVYTNNYAFQSDSASYEPIRIRITAIQAPALYSLKLQPITNESSVIQMTPGQHSYIYLSQGNEKCLGGYLRDKNEVVFFTVSAEEDLKLNKLSFLYKLKGEQTEKVQKEQVGNIIEIKYLFESVFFTEAMEYEICLVIQDPDYALSVIAFQNENVNILPMNTQVLIHDSNKYVLHPNGDLLVDLFVCKGDLDIRYATSEDKLKEDKSHDLQKIGIPGQSHAIKLEEYQTIFLQVQASQATMNWMPVDPEKQKGVGYFTYNIGDVKYDTSFNSITFDIGGVSQVKETNTSVYRVRYSLYIADTQENLHRAVMCQKFQDNVTKFISTYQATNNNLVNKTIRMTINKKKITDTFHKNTTLFYNVVADMKLKVPSQQPQKPIYETYKFIYFPQQVSAEVFLQNVIESTNLGMVTVLILVGVGGFLIVTCVLLTVILPTIGRIRNRMFVEENNQKDKSIPIPPSSDRNQIEDMKDQEIQQAPGGTEEEMK